VLGAFLDNDEKPESFGDLGFLFFWIMDENWQIFMSQQIN